MNGPFNQTSVKVNYAHTVQKTINAFRRNKEMLFHFAVGQLLLQALNLLNGFFLLRWLSINEQAKFSVAFSIQTLVVALSDLGFTGSIVALTGDRINDKKVLGSYINSAKRLRNYLLIFSCLITLLLLPFIIEKQAWNYKELFLLLLPVILSVFWQADCSLYNSTLVLHKKMKQLYRPQIIIAAFKLATNYLLYLTNFLGALSVLILNAISLLLTGKLFKKKAKKYIDLSEKDYSASQKEMFNYLKPLFPSLIFNAFYGQIQIFLISFFGKTANVAEVAALGRLNQLFIFLGSLNAIIISPVIAKSPQTELLKKFLTVSLISLLVAAGIYFLSVFIPGPFLFLLGPKYSHLGTEVNISILSSCLSYLGGAIWAMSSARKWLFWWASILYVVAVILCQLYGVIYFDLSKTVGVIELSLLTALAVLAVQITIPIAGFKKMKFFNTSI